MAIELNLYDYSYVMSPNIQTKKHVYGVLSAFRMSCLSERSLLTAKLEFGYATHKVALVTRHKMSNERELLIVNLHAINFVKNEDFQNELEEIKSAVKWHKGAMIVAGDFNSWNVKRMRVLSEFVSSLSLKEALFNDNSKRKKVFSNCLDYIFYRDLELVRSKVIDSPMSDHNPIVATFKNLDVSKESQ